MLSTSCTITREELYSSVWKTPGVTLAKDLNLSDRGLQKLCKRHDIPSPPRGYWQRKEAGKSVVIPPLPKSHFEPSFKIRIKEQREKTEKPTKYPQINVSDSLDGAHKLTIDARKALDRGKMDSWVADSDVLNIRATRGALPRALRIFDALIKAAEERGYTISVSSGHTTILINGQQVEVRLIERSTRVPITRGEGASAYQSYEYPPCGLLSFQNCDGGWTGLRQEWNDGKRQRVEDCLGEILAVMEQTADAKNERDRRWKIDEERRREAEQKRLELEKKVTRLEEEMAVWEKRERVKRYLDVLKEKEHAEPEWVKWVEGWVLELGKLGREISSADLY